MGLGRDGHKITKTDDEKWVKPLDEISEREEGEGGAEREGWKRVTEGERGVRRRAKKRKKESSHDCATGRVMLGIKMNLMF